MSYTPSLATQLFTHGLLLVDNEVNTIRDSPHLIFRRQNELAGHSYIHNHDMMQWRKRGRCGLNQGWHIGFLLVRVAMIKDVALVQEK